MEVLCFSGEMSVDDSWTAQVRVLRALTCLPVFLDGNTRPGCYQDRHYDWCTGSDSRWGVVRGLTGRVECLEETGDTGNLHDVPMVHDHDPKLSPRVPVIDGETSRRVGTRTDRRRLLRVGKGRTSTPTSSEVTYGTHVSVSPPPPAPDREDGAGGKGCWNDDSEPLDVDVSLYPRLPEVLAAGPRCPGRRRVSGTTRTGSRVVVVDLDD